LKNFEARFGYQNFLKVKGIQSYLEDLPPEFLKNRVCVGKFKRSPAQQIESDLVGGDSDMPVINVGSKIVLPSSIFWDELYGIIITSKSYDEKLPDEEILNESKLPAWMKMDTFYFFKFEEEDDETKPIQEYSAK
jgi:hypothetical protein